MRNSSNGAYDRTSPEGKWIFDADVTKVFENMLSRSIPQYQVMRRVVYTFGKNFINAESTIIDCGASEGGAIAPFVEMDNPPRRFICIESSASMAESLRKRFSGTESIVEIIQQDIRNWRPDESADLTLSVLTLQFVPIEHRQAVIQKLYDNLNLGGALIVVEKVLGSDGLINDLLVREYRSYKKENGYSTEEIDRKALSLEGVLVPVTADWNVELLRQGGFNRVDCIWRWMNFGAWIAIK